MDEELLLPANMADARRVLADRYSWFAHVKPIRKFSKIQSNGLLPRKQGCPINMSVSIAIGALVPNVAEMIFLRPLGDNVTDSTPRRGEEMFELAISVSAIPNIITVDWTFDGTWGLASLIKRDDEEAMPAEIFCQIVRRRGSLAIYEAIPASHLRVWTKGTQRDDPTTWPQILDTNISDLETFY